MFKKKGKQRHEGGGEERMNLNKTKGTKKREITVKEIN